MGTMYAASLKTRLMPWEKANGVEQVAGQTTTAVQMLKTTGDNMSAAFTHAGCQCEKAAGIDAAEQFAVLGQLQATMVAARPGQNTRHFLPQWAAPEKSWGLIS